MINVLFLCTGNSCRSQMAEGWCRHLKSEAINAFSAGTETHGMNPFAVTVMAEAGVDISGQYSKTTAMLKTREFDYVVTVCDNAHEKCPFFPAATRVVHQRFEDPPRLAKHLTDENEILNVYRKIRDEIKAYIETLPDALSCPEKLDS